MNKNMVNFIRTISSKWNTVDKTQYKDSIVFIEDTKQIYVNGVYYASQEPIESTDFMVSITYNDLKTLRDSNSLVAGAQYRITDYVATTVSAGSASANHQFDIVVTADSSNKLNENARAALHDGDTYFASSDLSSWKLRYSLDNNSTRWDWADPNGKGVIYQMVDEFGNEAQYDFKGIKFLRYLVADSDSMSSHYARVSNTTVSVNESSSKWFYLFNLNEDGTDVDASIGQYATGSPMNNVFLHKGTLLNGVFNMSSRNFPYNCHASTHCTGWTCGDNCYNWTCESYCKDWVCGNNCYDWSCDNNCYGWAAGNGCYRWSCKDKCNGWKCGLGCNNWTCENECHSWTCGQYCKNWICRSNNSLWIVGSDISNFEILSNTVQTSKNIGFDANAQYTQTAGLDMTGELFVWINSRSNYKLKIQEGTDTTIYPNSYNIWLNNRLPGIIRMAGRNTGGETREYLINFTVSGQTTTPSITFAQEVVWMNEAPIWQNGYIYEISIINVGNKNLATYNKFAL